jgi:hypothetical protein
MVPSARMTQRWPLRPWRSQRKMYVVIYRGALRRRIRRLARSRVFSNARTATRNRDLAIRAPSIPCFLLHRRILASAWRPQPWAFSGIRRVYAGRFSMSADRAGAEHTFLSFD